PAVAPGRSSRSARFGREVHAPGWPGDRRTRRRVGRTRRARPHRRAILPRARLADGQRPALQRLTVEAADDLFGDGTVGELHEGEASRTTGLAIHGQRHLCRLADLTEVRPELCLIDAVIQVADEQPNAHAD